MNGVSHEVLLYLAIAGLVIQMLINSFRKRDIEDEIRSIMREGHRLGIQHYREAMRCARADRKRAKAREVNRDERDS